MTIDKGGYRLVKAHGHPHATKSGYVREHRLVMEKMIGRYLLPSEVVHHKDENTANNSPDNLELFDSQAMHVSVTMIGKADSSRTAKAVAAGTRMRREWWPIGLMKEWYQVDRLRLKDIGHLLNKTHGAVSLALRRAGVCFDKKNRNGVVTDRHREQALAFLATAGRQRAAYVRT